MPIIKAQGYVASGVMYATVADAQLAEIRAIIQADVQKSPVEARAAIPVEHTAQLIYDWRNELLEILTTGPTSRPSARKRAGTTSPRRAAKRATEAQVATGLTAMRDAVEHAA